MPKEPKITLLGGGTGSYELLIGLKAWTPHITAVVNMCDDGGSTGRLRADYGVMPPGDVRQCLAALAADEELARAFSFRFHGGELGGHALGNVLLAGLEKQRGNFIDAVRVVSRWLRCQGQAVPVTADNHVLVMKDGEAIIRGQEQVRLHIVTDRAPSVWLEPEVDILPEAARAIREADMVVLAPGGLNWTLLPICAVRGVAEALRDAPGKVVLVTNIMNRPEQHQGWHVADYVRAFEKYLGRGVIDVVLYNTGMVEPERIKNYATAGEEPVRVSPEEFANLQTLNVGADIVATMPAQQDTADNAVLRTLIRHDSTQTAAALRRIFES